LQQPLDGSPLPEVIPTFEIDSSSLSVSASVTAVLETDADPNIPILKQEKAEYAKLQ
jgi:hypothetical protein